MAFELKGLMEKRGKLNADQRALWERAEKESRELTAEEKTQDAAFDAEFTALSARIDKLQALDARNAELAKRQIETGEIKLPAGDGPAIVTDETRAAALQGWMRAQSNLSVTAEQQQAMSLTGVHPGQRHMDLNLYRNAEYGKFRKEFRTGMSTSAAYGGYTIPVGFMANFETALLAFGGLRQVADVFRTDSGNAIHWPTANDTGNTGALLTEETTIGSTVNPTISEKIFYAYKISSTLIQVSPELLEDSAFDMAAQIGSWLGERIGRCEATYYATGTGSSQPTGLLAASGGTTAVTFSSGSAYTAATTAITADELLEVVHSVDPAYRPGAAWVMADATVLKLRKLKDGDGAYIWQPGMTSGAPSTLFGYPVQVDQAMPAMTAGLKAIAFGDLKKFKIRDVSQIRLRRLVERYADTDQEGFVAFHRTDSGLIDAGTHPVRHVLMHA